MPRSLTAPSPYYLLGALSGLFWGGVALLLGGRWLGVIVWGGVAAAPLIGVAAAAWYRPAYRLPTSLRALAALASLYAAATLFGIAVGLFDVARGVPNRDAVELVYQAVVGTLWGVTFTGYVLLLWPLAYVNHALLYRRSGEAP